MEELLAREKYEKAIRRAKEIYGLDRTHSRLRSALRKSRRRFFLHKYKIPLFIFTALCFILAATVIFYWQRSSRLLAGARSALTRGDYDAASSLSRKIISAGLGISLLEKFIFHGKKREAETILASSYLKMHRMDPEARRIYDRVLNYHSTSSQMIRLHAQICIQRDAMDDRVREIYEKAVRYFPEETIFLEKLSEYYRIKGIYDKDSARIYEKKELWEEAGKAYEYSGDWKKAEETYQHGDYKERQAELYYHQGEFLKAAQCYHELGKIEETAELFLKSGIKEEVDHLAGKLAAAPGEKKMYLRRLIKDFIAGGNIKKAIELLKKVLQVDRHDLESWKILAELFLSRSRIKEAIETYEGAALLFPDEDEFSFRLLNLYHQIGNHERFLILAERLRTKGMLALGKMMHLAHFYEQNRRYREAEEVYKEIIEKSETMLKE